MSSGRAHSITEFGRAHGVTLREHEHVSEVAFSRRCVAPVDHRDDLLREHRCQRIADDVSGDYKNKMMRQALACAFGEEEQ